MSSDLGYTPYKCCGTCKYGIVSEVLKNQGDNCHIICMLRSNILKGKIHLHDESDVCRKYEQEARDNAANRRR